MTNTTVTVFARATSTIDSPVFVVKTFQDATAVASGKRKLLTTDPTIVSHNYPKRHTSRPFPYSSFATPASNLKLATKATKQDEAVARSGRKAPKQDATVATKPPDSGRKAMKLLTKYHLRYDVEVGTAVYCIYRSSKHPQAHEVRTLFCFALRENHTQFNAHTI